jgi:hypothetical protein
MASGLRVMTADSPMGPPRDTEHVSGTGQVAGVGCTRARLVASGLSGLLPSAAAPDEEAAFALASSDALCPEL